MQRFLIPQPMFREDQIIGVLTWRQVAYLGTGLLLAYLSQSGFTDVLAKSLSAIPPLTFSICLALLRISGESFDRWLLLFAKYQLTNADWYWRADT